MPRKSNQQSDLINIIATNLRTVRNQAGLSMKEVAGELDLTMQQFSKYEKGINKISADRLARVAEILSVPVSVFYEGIEDKNGTNNKLVPKSAKPKSSKGKDNKSKNDVEVVSRMLKAYGKIEDTKLRHEMFEIILDEIENIY